MSLELSEQELIRREKLKTFEGMGVQAYPAAEYPVNVKNTEILNEFKDNPEQEQEAPKYVGNHES